MKFKHSKNLVLKDKKSIFLDKSVKIGDNVTIYENNRIIGDTVIGNGVTIFPGCFISDSIIDDFVEITSSNIDQSHIGEKSVIGPFARLRKGTKLEKKVKVGNFVEIKNSTIGEGSKISHLAYVGDVDMGKDCNIGCGVIFVNYNGRNKNRSMVGDECFIGSNCNIIAPVKIESRSYICAGTTVTEDIKSNDFVIGRVRQEVKENRADKYLKQKSGE